MFCLTLALALPLATPADDLFIEAETSPAHTFNDAADFPGIVSGDKILRLWRGEDPPAEGYYARFPFSVKTADSYHAWIGASVPGVASNFWWRVDEGQWGHIASDTLLESPKAYGVSNAMGWIELGTAPLKPGDHALAIRVNERRPILEHAYLVYLDAVLLTTRDIFPQGLVTAADVPKLLPKPPPPVPVKRAGKPGPPMMLGTSVMNDLQNHLAKSLGFSLSQTDSDHLTVNETSPGVWDWASADAGLEASRKAGVKWQYFPHYHWPPEWYRKTDKFVPCTGLRTGRKLACMSLWSPDIVPWFDHCYAALAEHYGGDDQKVAAIYLGVHGDFGEAIFPMGFHPGEKERFGPEGTGIGDFWCGAEPDRADFRRFASAKYGGLDKLNAAWGTTFASFDAVDYPGAAYGKSADVTSTPGRRRHWLDFIQWYYDGMTRFTGEVCRVARAHFPKSLLVLPLGGGAETLFYGQDNTALPKIAKQYGVHIRSTHGGYLTFAENYATMNRRIATASRFYGDPFWTEPPGNITPEGEVSRFMESLSCRSWGFWDWGNNPIGAADTFREYAAFLTREEPIVDVALFFPTTDWRLHERGGYPARLQAIGAQLRDVMDYDIVDEPLIRDGALKGYRVLVWIEGETVEADTLAALSRWVEGGGVVVRLGANAIRTVEGDWPLSTAFLGFTPTSALLKDKAGPLRVTNAHFLSRMAACLQSTSEAAVSSVGPRARVLATVTTGEPAAWAVPRGKGWVIVWAGTGTDKLATRTFCDLVRDTVYNLSARDRTKPDAREVDTQYDGVYATLLPSGEVILHNATGDERPWTLGDEHLTLPPHSLRSVMLR